MRVVGVMMTSRNGGVCSLPDSVEMFRCMTGGSEGGLFAIDPHLRSPRETHHRHCGDGGWLFGVAAGVASGGRSTARRGTSSFDLAFRGSRVPSLKQCKRQKLFDSPSSPPFPASASKAQVSGLLVFFPQTKVTRKVFLHPAAGSPPIFL